MKKPTNLVIEENSVIPNYDISDAKPTLDIYLSWAQKICIITRLDNNYICGLYLLNLSDKNAIQTVINDYSDEKQNYVSNEFVVLGDKHIDLSQWYRMQISINNDLKEPMYKCSGISYSFKQTDFAETINTFFNKLLKLCEARISVGEYLEILKRYKVLLSRYKRLDPQSAEYYEHIKPIIKIIKSEEYLKLSPDINVRDIYLALNKYADDLYGAYMDRVR